MAFPPQGRRVRWHIPQPGEHAGELTSYHQGAPDLQELPWVSPRATCAAGASHLLRRDGILNVFDIAERRFTKHKTWRQARSRGSASFPDHGRQAGDIFRARPHEPEGALVPGLPVVGTAGRDDRLVRR
jgi:hypothetical protein